MLVKRLNIELPGDQYEFLKKEAAARGVSVTSILRNLIEKYKSSKEEEPLEIEEDSFFKMGASFDSGVRDLSERHDDYLYREKR